MSQLSDVRKMAEYLVKYPISRFGVLPHVIRMLVETQLPSAVFEKIAQMSVIAIGGAALPKRLETEVGWVFQSLGIAKEKGIGWGDTDTDKISGSIGRLVPDMEAKILSEDGAELGPEEIGELALSGRVMMKGYHHNPPRPQTCHIISSEINIDWRNFRDGWFYTGDLANLPSTRKRDSFGSWTRRRSY
jgi:long-subunit acyl-CoA synthetase (AMP-forming)